MGVSSISKGARFTYDSSKDKPEAVKGLLRAINRALQEVMANPDAAIDLLAAKEPLIKKDIEKQRLLYVYKTLIDTPEARELGIGDVNDVRMSHAITTIAESYELTSAPKVEQVFDRAFLPPKADRMPRALGH